MMKRIFALILCMVMCLSLFPTAAFAESRVEETPAEETEELAPVGDGALDVPEDDAEAAEPVILSDSEGAQGEPNEDDASVDEGTRSRVSFRFSSFAALARTLQKSSDGRMKKPFSSIRPSLASSASASDILA